MAMPPQSLRIRNTSCDSHSARDLVQAPVSSKKRSIPSTRVASRRVGDSGYCITISPVLSVLCGGLYLQLGLFRPGLAWKPRLWLGLRRLWLPQPPGRAKAIGNGLALAWPGFRPRLFKAAHPGPGPWLSGFGTQCRATRANVRQKL